MPLAVEDVIAVHHLIARYSFAFDGGDATSFAECFTADGTFILGGEAVAEGSAALAAFVETTTTPGQLRHVVTSILVTGDADQAHNRCYCTVFSSTPGSGNRVVAQGVYEDKLTKDADGWRFAQRAFVPDPA